MSTGRVSSNVELGPGSLYAAAVTATEPASASAALPSANFFPIGYTEDGSKFGYALKVSPIMVEEEFDPIRIATTSREGKLTLKMAEITRRNLQLAINAGAGATEDSSLVEPPAPGSELRVMIVFVTDPQGPSQTSALWIFRQCLQSGDIGIERRKAPNKSMFVVEFDLEKPTGKQPWRAFPNADSLV